MEDWEESNAGVSISCGLKEDSDDTVEYWYFEDQYLSSDVDDNKKMEEPNLEDIMACTQALATSVVALQAKEIINACIRPQNPIQVRVMNTDSEEATDICGDIPLPKPFQSPPFHAASISPRHDF